jgi:hypothetical protein
VGKPAPEVGRVAACERARLLRSTRRVVPRGHGTGVRLRP